MAANPTVPYTCKICGTPTSLETCKIDEQGHIVHELCYTVRLEGAKQSLQIAATPRLRHNRKRPLKAQAHSAATSVFTGWKEIASYLRKGVRTLQRYEREMGLPIHRPSGKDRSAVLAFRSELDAWLHSSANAADSVFKRRALNNQTNVLRAQFLQIDTEIALTFANIALHTSDKDKRKRTIGIARAAYDTIMRLRENTDLTAAVSDTLDANMNRLRSELRKLGEQF